MKEISELLSNLFDRKFLQEGEEYLSFSNHWERIVGEDLSSHIKIDDIINNQLIVIADHPGWAQVFLLKKNAILSKIRKKFPQLDIRSIQIRYNDKAIKKKEIPKKNIAVKQEKVETEEIDMDFFELLDKFKERSDPKS